MLNSYRLAAPEIGSTPVRRTLKLLVLVMPAGDPAPQSWLKFVQSPSSSGTPERLSFSNFSAQRPWNVWPASYSYDVVVLPVPAASAAAPVTDCSRNGGVVS